MSSKKNTDAPSDEAVEAQAAPAPTVITLTEFCIRLSETEKRVELIGGFEADERRQGSKKDTAENYAVRFLAFTTRPA